MWLEFISLVSLAGGSLVLSAGSESRQITDFIIRWFIFACGQIVLCGYVLSEMHRLGDRTSWVVLQSLLFVVLILASRFYFGRWPSVFRCTYLPDIEAWREELMNLPLFAQASFLLLTLAVSLTAAANFIIAVLVPPGNWDSMTYHLARMGYYLQQGHLGAFDANYYAQSSYPKASAVLHIYAFVMSGRNDHWTQMVQFGAYLVALVAIYGTSRRFGAGRFASGAAAMTFALLPNVLMQSTTTQDDLLVASFVACAMYFLLVTKVETRLHPLLMATASLSLALATKTFAVLLIPSITLLSTYVLLMTRRSLWPNVRRAVTCASCVLGVLIVFVLPSGYWENWVLFRYPFGSLQAKAEMSLQGTPVETQFVEALKQGVRLSLESLSLDGLPQARSVNFALRSLRALPSTLIRRMNLGLEEPVLGRWAFTYARRPFAHEDWSNAGIAGFALFAPAILICLLGPRQSFLVRIVAGGAVLTVMFLCWATVYDPWQGRRMVTVAAFSTPVVAVLLCRLWQDRNTVANLPVWQRMLGCYLAAIFALTALAGVSAVVFRLNSSLVPVDGDSLWKRAAFHRSGAWWIPDRVAMLTRNRRDFEQPIRSFEKYVPQTAVVAVDLPKDQYEYPLFGEGLTRRLVPLNSFVRGRLPVPPDVDFLLYFEGAYPKEQKDIDLGSQWFLRPLKR